MQQQEEWSLYIQQCRFLLKIGFAVPVISGSNAAFQHITNVQFYLPPEQFCTDQITFEQPPILQTLSLNSAHIIGVREYYRDL